MADVFLIIVTVILSIVLIGVNFYLLALYCHPDDRGWGTSLMCKILVVFGLTLSWAQILVLPLDVSNSRGLGSGLDIKTLWYVIYITILVVVCILMPFAIFIYETDEDKTMAQRICEAMKLEFCTLAVCCLVIFISWAFLKTAEIPLEILTIDIVLHNNPEILIFPSNQIVTFDSVKMQEEVEGKVEIDVSFAIYIMALLSFIGWIFLVFFGGLGLSALPLDLIMEFVNRPTLRSSQEVFMTKSVLQKRTTELIQEGIKVKDEEKDLSLVDGWWAKREAKGKYGKQLNAFKAKVLELEMQYEIFKLEVKYLDCNPLVFVGKLILGIICSIVSIIWIVHIIVYVITKRTNGKPVSPFLNDILTGLEQSGITFLATAIFSFLSIYLLWCTQKGNLKMGFRIPLLFTLHPMKINETWMNSFLFNVNLVLITSVAVTNFCAFAFQDYTRGSDIDLIFNAQIQYLRFYNWFFKNKVFEIALVVWALLSAMFLIFCMKRKNEFLQELEKIKEARKQK